jgi:hypothetical protein
VIIADTLASNHRRTADRVFLGSVVYTGAITVVWLFFVVTQYKGPFSFGRYNIDAQAIGRVLAGLLFFSVLWGWIWYLVRRLLLKRLVGLSDDELRLAFSSRMNRPFHLSSLLARHSERRIRITDMIGRRGRFATIGLAGFAYLYTRLSAHPQPEFLTMGLQDTLFDAIVFNWTAVALYYSNGFFARMFYGAQSRLMDGSLARANCLLITSLWAGFKFVMVPIGVQMAARFPPKTFAPLFVFIWGSYLVSDALSEIVGSLFGNQKLRVWGVGEVNRKSIAGTWACFLGSLAVCFGVVVVNQLPLPWVGLAVVVSFSNTLLELFSPRGTDDFTMATANALLCWAFGVLVY